MVVKLVATVVMFKKNLVAQNCLSTPSVKL